MKPKRILMPVVITRRSSDRKHIEHEYRPLILRIEAMMEGHRIAQRFTTLALSPSYSMTMEFK